MRKTVLVSILILLYALQMLTYADFPFSPTPVFQKGMCYVTWTKDKYASPYSDESLAAMREVGVEWISIVVTWYQKRHDSTKISRTDKTPSDQSLRHVINKAHELGFKVMLKPHIDLVRQTDSEWRADIGFASDADWRKWFAEYRRFITHYAKMSQKEGVELFCVGTELAFAATARPEAWKTDIIPSVRKVYSGPLVYAANWRDEYDQIEFWNELDYAGLDAYFPLAKSAEPAYDEIKQSWQRLAAKIEVWQRKINKPVLFTEIGYCSAKGSAGKPWVVAMKGDVDLDVQAHCYRALLETMWEKPWFYGVYWWKWNVNDRSGGVTHRRFTPQNKPAEKVVADFYKKRAVARSDNGLEKRDLVRYTN